MVGSFFARKPLMKQINVFMGKLHKMHPNYMANLLSAMTLQGCRKRGGCGGFNPQFLAEQLTLSQPGGGEQIMPTTVLQAPPPDF